MSATDTTVLRPDKTTTIVVNRRVINILQLDLFADYKAQWIAGALELIQSRRWNRFAYSELRRAYRIAPGHPNWWGGLCNRLRADGWRKVTTVRSTTESRNGGSEGIWERVQ